MCLKAVRPFCKNTFFVQQFCTLSFNSTSKLRVFSMKEYRSIADGPKKKELRVAVMLGYDGVFHRTIAGMFRDLTYVNSVGDLTASMINVPMDPQGIQRMTQNLLDQKYGLFVPIGARCAVNAKKVIDQVGGHPMIFIGARNPEKLGLVESMERPGSFCSGVVREPLDHLAVIKKLIRIAPFRKRLLLPYNPASEAGAIAEQVIEIKKYIAANSDMIVHAVATDTHEDSVQAFRDYEGKFDVALILEGCTTERVTEELSKWCWEKEVLLCGVGEQALSTGVSCVMGGGFYPYAEQAFAMLQRYWKQGIALGTQPVHVIPNNQSFTVNIHVLRSIGLQAHEIEEFCDDPEINVLRLWP
jgi:ABC-type uncharacterized transport system substrate-binding protein